jgi:hypothetical protein
VTRAAVGAIAGLLSGWVALIAACQISAGFVFEMDRPAPRPLTGVHGPERASGLTYMWTHRQIELALPGLDRSTPWTCVVRLRGARPDPATLPSLVVAVDGVARPPHQVSNEWEDVTVDVPDRRQDGLVVSLALSNTFRPSAGDRRDLGVMLDRWSCAPVETTSEVDLRGRFRVVWPPAGAQLAAAAACAVLGAAAGFSGVTLLPLLGTILVIAAAQGTLLARGLAAFGGYPTTVVWLASAVALSLLAITALARRRARGPLRAAALYVIVLSGIVLFLKSAALLHPAKPLADAVFHAHRLTAVLNGDLFFTQPLASGLRFPYAVGLYVFAAPWTILVTNYVALLWIVVVVVEVIAGALIYVVISRAWQDASAGALAVTLCHCVPLTYGLMGDANLTNLFAQQVGLITMTAVALWPLERRIAVTTVGLTGLAAAAFLSHVSTFGLLAVTLLATAALFRIAGGPGLRAPARSIALATVAAAVVAVVVYYAHFPEVYARLGALMGSGELPGTVPGAEVPSVAGPGTGARLLDAVSLTTRVAGLPVLVLAAAGLLRLLGERRGGRLVLVLGGWGIAFACFFLVGVLAPVDPGNVRYAAEFVNRVVLATYPAAAILGGVALATLWRGGLAARGVGLALTFVALIGAAQAWLRWLD